MKEPIDIVVDSFRKRGYRKIGEGLYATVVAKDDVAIKICYARDNLNTIEYLNYCKTHWKKNPVLPRVYYTRELENGVYCIAMERLKKNTAKSSKHPIVYFHDNYEDPLSKENKVLWDKNPMKALKAIKNISEDEDDMDLHEYNILFRGKQPVFVDPLAG